MGVRLHFEVRIATEFILDLFDYFLKQHPRPFAVVGWFDDRQCCLVFRNPLRFEKYLYYGARRGWISFRTSNFTSKGSRKAAPFDSAPRNGHFYHCVILSSLIARVANSAGSCIPVCAILMTVFATIS